MYLIGDFTVPGSFALNGRITDITMNISIHRKNQKQIIVIIFIIRLCLVIKNVISVILLTGECLLLDAQLSNYLMVMKNYLIDNDYFNTIASVVMLNVRCWIIKEIGMSLVLPSYDVYLFYHSSVFECHREEHCSLRSTFMWESSLYDIYIDEESHDHMSSLPSEWRVLSTSVYHPDRKWSESWSEAPGYISVRKKIILTTSQGSVLMDAECFVVCNVM